ncbi:MAG: hypothetical protein QW590_00660 [Candidatus Bilamarchaeaceae archaeon]
MAIGLEVVASNIAAFLLTIAPVIGLILLVLGGILYGLSFTQPADSRGKWQSIGVSMMVGGVIVAAIAGASSLIMETASGLLK